MSAPGQQPHHQMGPRIRLSHFYAFETFFCLAFLTSNIHTDHMCAVCGGTVFGDTRYYSPAGEHGTSAAGPLRVVSTSSDLETCPPSPPISGIPERRQCARSPGLCGVMMMMGVVLLAPLLRAVLLLEFETHTPGDGWNKKRLARAAGSPGEAERAGSEEQPGAHSDGPLGPVFAPPRPMLVGPRKFLVGSHAWWRCCCSALLLLILPPGPLPRSIPRGRERAARRGETRRQVR